jgi:hypothetical protein
MRLVDADKLEYTCNSDECGMLTGCNHCQYHIITEDELDSAPTVEAIPKEEVRQFIENIQKIKDNHNEHGEPINYGTICGILIEGYRLLDKYKENTDGNK